MNSKNAVLQNEPRTDMLTAIAEFLYNPTTSQCDNFGFGQSGKCSPLGALPILYPQNFHITGHTILDARNQRVLHHLEKVFNFTKSQKETFMTILFETSYYGKTHPFHVTKEMVAKAIFDFSIDLESSFIPTIK